jgi:endonuclease/exonuclease/phosphatase family metal-dependent hydrolase
MLKGLISIMKLVTLNLWGGIVSKEYKKFFEKYPDIDIWCFQEVYKDVYGPHQLEDEPNNFRLYDELQKYLPSHKHEFSHFLKDAFGIASFVNKDIKIAENGEIMIARGNYEDLSNPERDMNRKAQWLELEVKSKKVLIVNTHFTHRPVGKRDSEKRLRQSKIIVDFLSMFDCPKILVGDFNLLPDTESINIIERSGMKNLIKEYGVTSTRTELYTKEWKFADYIFVSPEIKINDFKVLPDVVSDHSPVYLDFDIV